MKLKTGRIYLMKYFHYKHDKEPLILVLYHGMNRKNNKEIVHGMNLNYLSDKLNDQLIEIIVKIATSQIKSKNAYDLYHNQLKHRIPNVIAKCYRTYIWQNIGKPIPVSRGFDDTTHFIKNLKNAFKKSDIKKIENLIKSEVDVGKTKQKMLKDTYNPQIMSSEDILEFVDNYIKLIQQVKIDDNLRSNFNKKFTKR